jgi:hypothetical protein
MASGPFFLAFTFLLIFLTENDHWGWSTGSVVAAFAALWLTGIFNIYNYTLRNPWDIVTWTLYYIGVGIVWGGLKWWKFCRKELAKYELAKSQFLKDSKATELTPELRIAWTERLKNNNYTYSLKGGAPPLAANYKERIINWMAFWPYSVLGTIFSDWVRELFNTLYDMMGGVYDSISRAVWKGVADDIATAEEMKQASKDVYRCIRGAFASIPWRFRTCELIEVHVLRRNGGGFEF